MAGVVVKILVALGYLLFLSSFGWYFYHTFHEEVLDYCTGEAFQPGKNGNGEGKCGKRYSFYNSLLRLEEHDKKVIYGTAEEFIGSWKGAKKFGIGTYSKFSLWFQPNQPPFEGDDKVEFSGNFADDLRNGYGTYRVQEYEKDRVLSWKGFYNKGDLTTQEGELHFVEYHSSDFYIKKEKKFSYPFRNTVYRGNLKNSLMNGKGSLSFDAIELKDVETKDGVLVSVSSPLKFTYEPTKKQIQCKLSGISSNAEKKIVVNSISCDNASSYKWESSSLQVTGTQTNDEADVYVKENLEKVFSHYNLFQKTFIEKQTLDQNFQIPTFSKQKAQ